VSKFFSMCIDLLLDLSKGVAQSLAGQKANADAIAALAEKVDALAKSGSFEPSEADMQRLQGLRDAVKVNPLPPAEIGGDGFEPVPEVK
jgi:hypothetical protein